MPGTQNSGGSRISQTHQSQWEGAPQPIIWYNFLNCLTIKKIRPRMGVDPPLQKKNPSRSNFCSCSFRGTNGQIIDLPPPPPNFPLGTTSLTFGKPWIRHCVTHSLSGKRVGRWEWLIIPGSAAVPIQKVMHSI